MHRVVVLAVDGVFPFELGIPLRVFDAATGADGEPLYSVVICTVDGGPVTANGGFSISPAHDGTALSKADTVVIAPFDIPGTESHWRVRASAAANALSGIRPGARIVSICTGAYALGLAGVLDGLTVTTHWSAASHFQHVFPATRVDPDVLFVDNGQILTSAGAAAGVDLCLHLVRRDHGSAAANRAARVCVVPPWREGGQAQFIERPVPAPSSASTSATRSWAAERIHQPIAVTELAKHAGMSIRSFNRRFREEVGMTPVQWLTRQRLDYARNLLENTQLPIDDVAAQAGLGGGSSLRQHLRAALGVSPTAYRRTFNKPGSGR